MWEKYFNKENFNEIVIWIGIVAIILLSTYLLARLVKMAMLKKKHFTHIDQTRYKFMAHLLSGFIYFLGIGLAIFSIPPFRSLGTSFFAGSGVIAIIIGFAAQHAFANIVGGVFIAIFKPFRIGDRLKFIGKEVIGIVEDITLRHTVIRTYANKRIIIPNSVISSEILENSNIVDHKIMKYFDISISYNSDVDKAMSIIKEEALAHPGTLDNRSDEDRANGVEPVIVRILTLDDFAVRLRAWIWTSDPIAAFRLVCDLNKSVKARFDSEGVEIPVIHCPVNHPR